MEATELGLAGSVLLQYSVAFGKAPSHFPLQSPWREKKDLCSIRHISYKTLALLFPTVLT